MHLLAVNLLVVALHRNDLLAFFGFCHGTTSQLGRLPAETVGAWPERHCEARREYRMRWGWRRRCGAPVSNHWSVVRDVL